MKFTYCCHYAWMITCALVVLGSSLYANHDADALSSLDDIAGPSAWTYTHSEAKVATTALKDVRMTSIGLWTTATTARPGGGIETDDDFDTINDNTDTAGKVDAYTRGDVRVYLNRGTTIANACLSALAILLFLVTMVTKKRCYNLEFATALTFVLFGLCSLFGVWWWWRSSYLNWARVEKDKYTGYAVDNEFCARECKSAALGGGMALYCGLWMLIVSSGHFMCRLNEEYEEEDDKMTPVVVTREDADVEVGETKKQAQRRMSEPLVAGPTSSEPEVDENAGPTGNGYTHWVGRERNALDRNHSSKHVHHQNA